MNESDQQINLIIPQGRQGVSLVRSEGYGARLSKKILILEEVRLWPWPGSRVKVINTTDPKGRAFREIGSPVKGKRSRKQWISTSAVQRNASRELRLA